MTLAILVLLATAACGAPPAAGPAAAPTTQPDPPPQTAAGDLLDRLERSADDLRDFNAQVIYWKWDGVLERDEIRQGRVVYQVTPDAKRFAILLERLIVGTNARNVRKDYVFDGSWLVEIDYDARLFLKRQIVPPGRSFDPLKLGEGPFPLPIGQARRDVTARFDVQPLELADSDLAGRLKGRAVEGLRLVPKPEAPEAADVESVDVFYDAATLLPVGILLAETNGDRKTVVLRGLKRNAGIDERLLSIEEPDPRQWRIDVRPWE